MNNKRLKIKRDRIFRPAIFLLAVFGILMILPPVAKKEAEAVIDADLYSLGIASLGNIEINLDPFAGQELAVVKDTITTNTNSPAGYNLLVSTNSASNELDLSDNGDTIIATSGTSSDPAALNTTGADFGVWGYAVAGLGNFDSSYNTSDPSDSSKFAATPTKDNEALIRSHSGVATNDTTDIYYGFKASRSLPAGQYESTILYTTMADVSSSTAGEATATGGSVVVDYTESPTVTVNTSLSTSRTLGTITATVGGQICTDLSVLSTNPLSISCEAPADLAAGTYDIMVNVPRLGKSYTVEDGFEVIPKYTCTKQYRLQNADGTYPSSYTADGTEIIQRGEICSYYKTVTDYQPLGVATEMDEDKTLSLDLPRNTYTLTVSKDDTYIDSVSGSGTYRWGQTVNISATPKSNNRFTSWEQLISLDYGTFGNANAASTTFTMPKSDAYVQAKGEKILYTCTKRYRLQNADGTYPSSYTADGTESVQQGSTCSYSKTVSYYQTKSTSAVMDGNKTLSLDLPRNTYTLTVDRDTAYITAVSGAGTYRWGQSISISASVAASSLFNGWTQTAGTASSFGNAGATSTTFTMPKSNATVKANGKIKTFTCTKQYRLQNANGTYPSSYTSAGSQTINYGSTCSYTQTASGYQQQSTSKTNMTANATLSLDLPRNTYTLTVNRNTSYISSVSGGGTYRWGQTVNISATASSSGRFTGWSLSSGSGTIANTGAASTTFTMTTSNATIYANGAALCSFTSQTFGYTGGMQSFTVPAGCAGTYTLEVWGAQGGQAKYNDYHFTPGNGGYAKGSVSLTAGTVLYIGVGGAGGTTAGGYNGGGSSNGEGGGGGGATHIGKTNSVLSSTAVNNLYLVAGGGGGAGASHLDYYTHNGGHGGGTNGGNGICNPSTGSVCADGGTQNSGYAYGVGGSVSATYEGAGGGGGYYGGKAGGNYNGGVGGGGGSGYTGGVSGGSMSNGARSGNGQAKITRQ